MIEKKVLADKATAVGKRQKVSFTNTGEMMAVFHVEAPRPTDDIAVKFQLLAADDATDLIGRDISNGVVNFYGKGTANFRLGDIQTNRQEIFLLIKEIAPQGAKVTCTILRAENDIETEEREGSEQSTLPSPFYFDVDEADSRLTVRSPVNFVDSQVFKFGSGEADIFKSNLLMGGFRQVLDTREELFIARMSTAGDRRAVSLGNMDTTTPTSIVCGSAGSRESRMRTDAPVMQATTGVVSTNALGGTRITIDFTSSVSCSWRSLDINPLSTATGAKFNTRIVDSVTGDTLSEHQPEAQFFAGGGEAKFTKNVVQDTALNLPFPQPYPVPAGATVRLVYDFDKSFSIVPTAVTLKGFSLVLGRIGAITDMTATEVAALPTAEKWRNREIQKTDGIKELCRYPADNAVLSPSGVPVGTILSGLWLHPSFGNLPIPDGYVALNGAVINAPWSSLHGLTTPNTLGRVLANAGGGEAVGASAGSTMFTLDRSNLPNILLNGSTTYTPSGSISTKTYPGYGAVPYSTSGYNWTGPGSTGSGGVQHAACPSFSGVSMEHDHYFSGSTVSIAISNIYLNGNVTQQAVPMRQMTYYVTQVLKL